MENVAKTRRSRRRFLRNAATACASLAPAMLVGKWEAIAMTSPTRAEEQPHNQARTGTSLSREGIQRLQETMAGYVLRGEVPGLTWLVARREQVSAEALGTRAVGAADRLVQRNTIFRIASMTKAITAAATMMLVEDSKLKLDEPID